MIYTQKIQHAIRFAIKTHEGYQKQKRKGKDVPYITHPLTVGLILAATGAAEDIIIAGILHDTIEDSIEEKKVTKEMIVERFGYKVYELVLSVTEQDKSLSWEERKAEALEHIKNFSNDSLLLKSADVISNISETLNDYEKEGEKVFERFHASKDKILESYIKSTEAILNKWSENPLADDIKEILKKVRNISSDYTEPKTYVISGEEYLKIGGAVEPFFKDVRPSEPPQFALITGGTGAGKTTLRREKFSEGYVNFDFAEISRAIEKTVGEKHPRLIEYSFWGCDIVIKECILEKKNIVVEIIGDNYDQIDILITKMKEVGYEVSLNTVTCDVAEAYKRHIKATNEDKDYMSSYFSDELTLLSIYTYFGLSEVPSNRGS
jgi:adenylate kinase family enzyme